MDPNCRLPCRHRQGRTVVDRAGNLAGFLLLYVRDHHPLLDGVASVPCAQRSTHLGMGSKFS